MKIIDGSLERTLQRLAKNKSTNKDFPADHSRLNYYDRYKSLSDKLHADYHPRVTAGSMAVDGGLLTDHGSEHINTVIQRASLLLDYKGIHKGNELEPYEIYLRAPLIIVIFRLFHVLNHCFVWVADLQNGIIRGAPSFDGDSLS